MKEAIKKLVEKSLISLTGGEAMHYTQAALNLTQALAVQKDTDLKK